MTTDRVDPAGRAAAAPDAAGGGGADPATDAGAALLPVLGTPPRMAPPTGAACVVDDEGCITCGDVAVALTVVEVGEFDAVCRDDRGRTELVATELVGPLSPGDQVLVHAKVALERLSAVAGTGDATQTREGDVHALR